MTYIKKKKTQKVPNQTLVINLFRINTEDNIMDILRVVKIYLVMSVSMQDVL